MDWLTVPNRETGHRKDTLFFVEVQSTGTRDILPHFAKRWALRTIKPRYDIEVSAAKSEPGPANAARLENQLRIISAVGRGASGPRLACSKMRGQL